MNSFWQRRFVPSLVGALIVAALAAVRIADPYPIEAARNIAFDLYQRLDPRPSADLPVRVVDIDDASLAAFGQWPWPRSELAILTNRLKELGAAAIAFDMLFSEPDRLSPHTLQAGLAGALPSNAALPDYDAEFARALADSPSVLGFGASLDQSQRLPAPKAGIVVSGDDPIDAVPHLRGAAMPIAALAEAAHGLGGLSLNAADEAGTVRRLPLLWASGKSFVPSLGVEALRVAAGERNLIVFGETNGSGFLHGLRVGDFTIPTTSDGNLILYYRHIDPQLYVSAKSILGPGYQALAPRIAGQIVLVGTSAAGLLDLRGTAIGDNMPGVAIHAQALEQMLSGDYLTRADWVSGLEIVAFIVTGLALVAAIAWAGPALGLAVGLGVLAILMAGSWIGFTQYRLLIDPSFLGIGAFVVFAAMTFLRFAVTDADRRQIRRAFGHFVSPALLAEIERSREDLKLGGEIRELTVMFADVRNFTSMGEALPPDRLLAMLNTLFGALGAEVTGSSGTIDKFIGDALMAFWNAPVEVEDHALRAAHAALAMRRRVAGLNDRDGFAFRADGAAIGTLDIGIGLATGPALVGNMGLETRFDYSCIGDTVNLASRLEGATKAISYDIVVSDPVRAAAPGLAYLEAGSVTLKGKAEPEPVHVLVGGENLAADRRFLALRSAHDALVAALRAGADTADQLADCRTLATPVDTRLLGFYDCIATRAGDFRAAAEIAPIATAGRRPRAGLAQ